MKRFWSTFALSLVFFIQPAFADVILQAKALLQGAYDTTSGLMRDDLRSKDYLPTAQPYNLPPFNYVGEETVSAELLGVTGDQAMVDWVLLDVRDGLSQALLARKALLLQRDGSLFDPQTGRNNITFSGIAPGTYRVGIHHRNHLGTIVGEVALAETPSLLDFSHKGMLLAGDVDANAKMISVGPGNDVTVLLGYVLTEPGNSLQSANYRMNGYFNTDLNLDGVTVYAGPGNDLNLLQSSILLHPDNVTFSMNFIVEGVKASHTLTTGVNLAQQFGLASQGTDYDSASAAARAVDGKPDTFNHTTCDAQNNWWQVKLPDPTQVSKIVITSRSGWGSRIKDAGVYLSASPYSGTLIESEKVATLAGVTTPQTIAFSNPKAAAYVIVKAVDSLCLHLSEVEVFGQAPTAPHLEQTQHEFLLRHDTPFGTVVGTLAAVDYQQDALSYVLEGDVPFAVDSQGTMRVNGGLQAGTTYSFQLAVSDDSQTSRAQVAVKVTATDAVEDALRSGMVTAVTDGELLDATLDTITTNQNLLLDAKAKLFNLNADGTAKMDGSSLTALDWNPTHDAALLLSTYGLNTGVLNTNAVYTDGYTVYDKEIGIIGASPARYLVLGGNPLRSGNVTNAQMQQFMENSFAWLTQRDDLKTAAFKVVIAHLDESYYFKDESSVRTWLDTHYPGKVSYNAANSCDDDKLASCLTAKPDVLIISQVANTGSDAVAIAASVQAAMQQGIPVLYLHHDGGLTALGEKLFPLFNVSYQWDNYWKKLGLKAFDVTTTLGKLPDNIRTIQTLLHHFKAQDYAFDWSTCVADNCSAVAGLQTEFQQGADTLRAMMTELDKGKVNLFGQEGFRLQKLLALLGDAYRQQVRFPMDKTTTNGTAFLKSLFADHAVYNYRAINPAQPDMGNFSRSNFSHVTPATKTVTLTSRQHFRAAGVYALPGQTFRVTRTDNSPTTTKVFVNTLRPGSTHEFEAAGYKRPKYLQSVHIPLQSGETIAMTSPYGGPIQLEFSANDQPVSFTFEQVGEHPFWDDAGDNASFTAKLAQGDYDWAEFITPAFEIHSTLDKMRTSASDTRWGGTLEGFAAATMRYTHNFPHVLAGFKGPGIDVVPEIHDFVAANGYDIDNLDLVKHMNADQATCGAGCSGNPYDAYWSFEPIGHGDIHELGHGLEKSRLRFNGWEVHTMTNPYSYYTKSQYFKTTGGEPECQNLPFEKAFTVLQASRLQADPAAYVKAKLWDTMGWSEGAATFIQMMMAAQDQGALQDGWHLLARLHIMEREFARATADTVKWEAKRGSLGFGAYTLDEAKALDQNDWLLVAISHASGRDYRSYFDTWALPYSPRAGEQVAVRGFAVMPSNFYISSPAGYCKGEGFDGNKLPVDGAQLWPLAAKKSRLMGDSFRASNGLVNMEY